MHTSLTGGTPQTRAGRVADTATARPTRVVRVWHVGAWNRNFGDWALAYQMHRLLNEQAAPRGWHLDFYLVDGQRTFWYPELIDHLNEDAELIILGGGGHLFHRPEDRSRSGWMFNTSPDDLERIQPPLVVYGIGYNRFPYDPNEFPPVTQVHLRKLQEKAALFSSRNSGSRTVLVEQFGLRPDKIDLIPDPGVCLYDRPVRIPVRHPTGPVIALNWAGDRPHDRFPEPAEEHMRRFLGTLKRALLRCVEELGAQVMWLAHLLNVDTDAYAEFAEGFPPGSIFSTHLELPFLYPPPGELMYPHVPFFTNLFRQADVVLGMRGHACILAFGAGTKFMPIGEHQKVSYFGADVGMPREYLIRTIPSGSGADEELFGKVRACLADDAYGRRIKDELARQVGILRAFNERVLDLVAQRTQEKRPW